MSYVVPEIKDVLIYGRNKFDLINLADGRVELIPHPDNVVEIGTPINRALLRQMAQGIKNNETLINNTATNLSEEIEEKAGVFSLGSQKVTIGVI